MDYEQTMKNEIRALVDLLNDLIDTEPTGPRQDALREARAELWRALHTDIQQEARPTVSGFSASRCID